MGHESPVTGLPNQDHAIAGRERPDKRWYDWFRRVEAAINGVSNTGGETSGLLSRLLTRLGSTDGTPDTIPDTANRDFIEGAGIDIEILRPRGDVQIALETVTDAGGGTLQKTDVDEYGRVTGTSAATTSDLPEGSNLYFTDARAQKASLSPTYIASGDTFTVPADKQALYSLPIEVDGLVEIDGALVEVDGESFTQAEADALYVPKSRTISTAAPLTGGGDLSANRTLAMPAATASVDGYMKATDFAAFNSINAAFLTSSTGRPLMTSTGDFITTSGA